MSDLQLSLLALGAVIIAAVILFNWWQERRFMQESIRRFEGPADDVLMDEFQIDPERVVAFETESIIVEDRYTKTTIPEDVLLEDLQPRRSSRDDEPVATPARSEPVEDNFVDTVQLAPKQAPDDEMVFRTTPSKADEVPETQAEFQPEEFDQEAFDRTEPDELESVEAELEEVAALMEAAFPEETQTEETPEEPIVSTMPTFVDEQVDLIGKAALPSMLDMGAFIQAIQQMPKFDKPVYWFLQDETGVWRTLTPELPSGRYPQMACALQLADRAGPVSQGTLMAFQEQVQNLATILGAKLAWHGATDPLQYAVDLDRFCIDVDVMVGFHILQGASGPFAGTKLRGLAESAGLKLHDDGAFHCENADGETLYTMVSQDQRPFKPETLRTVFYRGVSFQLDVPKVESSSDAFNRMVTFARQLEVALDGVLVDDNQRALGDIEIEKIRQQLRMIHAKMVARFILPGTPTAIRLFS